MLAVIAPSAPAGSIPADGIDVYLSPDLLKAVQDTINSKCGSETNPDCQQSVQQVLRHNSVNLQQRAAVIIAIVAGLAIAQLTLYLSVMLPRLHKGSKSIPVPIHIPADQLSQITAAASASAVAVATGSDRPYVTITRVPKPTAPTGYVDMQLRPCRLRC